jgi:hypothetical protein
MLFVSLAIRSLLSCSANTDVTLCMQTSRRGRPRFTIEQWRARAAEAGVEADVVQAHTDDPAALQRLANNARRRSRSTMMADDDSVVESSQRVRDFRNQRTDEEKAADRDADSERKRDVRQTRSEEEKATDRLHHARLERDRLARRSEEEKIAVRYLHSRTLY